MKISLVVSPQIISFSAKLDTLLSPAYRVGDKSVILRQSKTNIEIPAGLLPDVKRLLKKRAIDWDIIKPHHYTSRMEYNSIMDIDFTKQQHGCMLTATEARRGVFFGMSQKDKINLTLILANSINDKALLITDDRPLFDQIFLQRITYGILNLTVVQQGSNPDVNKFRMLIIDNVEKISERQHNYIMDLVSNFKYTNRFGYAATLPEDSFSRMVMKAHFGRFLANLTNI